MIRLDELAVEIGIGKFNREWYEGYMIDEVEALLGFFGHQDKELSALFEKHADTSLHDITNEEETIAMAASLSEMFGFDVDARELLQKGQSYFDEYKKEIFDHIRNNFNENAAEEDGKHKKKEPEKKKTSEEANHLAKDARNIYLRLIKSSIPTWKKTHN